VLPLKDNVPTARFPLVTVILIALNLAAFAWQLSLPSDRASSPELARAGVSERDQASIEYGAIPYRITHPGSECGVTSAEIVCGDEGAVEVGSRKKGSAIPEDVDAPPWWLTLITSMFLHGGLLHFGGNMLFLWIFGNTVEGAMGRMRFALFYLSAGLIALYAQAALAPDATGPIIGASGAVAGVLGGYALLHPRAKVLGLVLVPFFVTLVEIPALLLIALWFALQFVPAVGPLATPELAEGSIAYLAHVAGFVFGLAAIRLFARRRERPEAPIPVY